MSDIVFMAGALNLVLGLVYSSYGVMTYIDMSRNRALGFSHFGLAWIFMAFTCGPHHFVHGIHILEEGRMGGGLDLLAVAIGFPAGIGWFFLRLNALEGERADYQFSKNTWIRHILPIGIIVYILVMVGIVFSQGGFDMGRIDFPYSNLLLVGIYGAIGYFLLQTQIRNSYRFNLWSLSGMFLTLIFFTCAIMHGIFAFYTGTGQYEFDIHAYVIDILAVPAGAYFLWVVRGLYKGTLRDWNTSAGTLK